MRHYMLRAQISSYLNPDNIEFVIRDTFDQVLLIKEEAMLDFIITFLSENTEEEIRDYISGLITKANGGAAAIGISTIRLDLLEYEKVFYNFEEVAEEIVARENAACTCNCN